MKKCSLLLLAMLAANQAVAQVSDSQAKQAISYFYDTYVFDTNFLTPKTAKQLGTKRFLAKLEQAYDMICDDKPCYGVFALRTGAQDGYEDTRKVESIKPRANGWYRVSYRDMGYKGITDVKVVAQNGLIKLDDYKQIFDGAARP